ncbi:MAG: sigma-70 family RNA polymerase sigma factor [Planctomycetota bacterium]
MVLSDFDRELLNRCLARADGAWEAFIDRYLALLTHVVTSTAAKRFPSVPDHLRDDMVAEILLALVDNDYAILRRFQGQSSLGTYLVIVARRIVARRLGKLPNLIPDPHLEVKSENGEVPDLDNAEEVQALLSKLSLNEATAIRLYHLEHRSYSDIGARMGIPENSVGPLLTQARNSMRQLRDS